MTLDVMHTWVASTQCTGTTTRIRCKDTVGGVFKATFVALASNPGVYRMKVSFSKITVNAPFLAPVTVTLTHDSVVIRTDTIMDCKQTAKGLNCHES